MENISHKKCECINSEDKDRILVALDIAEEKYNNHIENLKRQPNSKHDIDKNVMIQASKKLIEGFKNTKQRIIDCKTGLE